MSNRNNFVVRASRFSIIVKTILTFAPPLIVTIMYLFDFHFNMSPENIAVFTPMGIFIGVIYLFMLARAISWKYTIQGNEIHYRTLFRRGVITFSDIKRVWLYRLDEGRRLFRDTARTTGRLSILNWNNFLDFHCPAAGFWLPPIPITADGYSLFVARLKARKITGAKDL